MIFSFYQNKKNTLHNKSEQNDFQTNQRDKNMAQINTQKKNKNQVDKGSRLNQVEKLNRLDQLKRKFARFQQMNKLTSVSTCKNPHKKNKSSAIFFVDSKKNVNSNQSNYKCIPIKEEKPLKSQPEVFEQRRRRSHYNKFFKQSLTDNEHNFIGKGYYKQAQNLKVSQDVDSQLVPTTNLMFRQKSLSLDERYKPGKQSADFSPSINRLIKKTKSNFLSSSFLEQGYKLKNKLSLNEQQLSGFVVSEHIQLENKYQIQILCQKIKRQKAKNNDKQIKCQMMKLKKPKLNRFTIKGGKRYLKKQLQVQNLSLQKKKLHSGSFSPQKNIISIKNNTSDARINIDLLSDNRSHSSFGFGQQKISPHKHGPFKFTVIEQIVPWQGQQGQFTGL